MPEIEIFDKPRPFVFSNGESYPGTLENGSDIVRNLQRLLPEQKLAVEKAQRELSAAERRLSFTQAWIDFFYPIPPTRMAEYSGDYQIFAIEAGGRGKALICANSPEAACDLWRWLDKSLPADLKNQSLSPIFGPIKSVKLVPSDMPISIRNYRASGQFTVQQAAWFAYDVDAKYNGESVMIWSTLSDGQGSPWSGIARSTSSVLYGRR